MCARQCARDAWSLASHPASDEPARCRVLRILDPHPKGRTPVRGMAAPSKQAWSCTSSRRAGPCGLPARPSNA
eukprot:364992-Chlamydomonas_euryale.AAC.5